MGGARPCVVSAALAGTLVGMSFGQQSGPPASTKQVAYLLSLLNADGFDFATALKNEHAVGVAADQGQVVADQHQAQAALAAQAIEQGQHFAG